VGAYEAANKGQLVTTANTAVPAGSKIAELRARQDRLV
jgi:predicted homoserine dehydrogenase-like protein